MNIASVGMFRNYQQSFKADAKTVEYNKEDYSISFYEPERKKKRIIKLVDTRVPGSGGDVITISKDRRVCIGKLFIYTPQEKLTNPVPGGFGLFDIYNDHGEILTTSPTEVYDASLLSDPKYAKRVKKAVREACNDDLDIRGPWATLESLIYKYQAKKTKQK